LFFQNKEIRLKSTKLIADSLNTNFLAAAETANSGTDNLATEDAVRNLVEAIVGCQIR
jgi:hypothetical protein